MSTDTRMDPTAFPLPLPIDVTALRSPRPKPPAIPPLRNGDHLTADEFWRRYQAMPELKKAELIKGVVYVASPVSEDHADNHFDFTLWLGLYRAATPGVGGAIEGTLLLGPDDLPQPDVHLKLRASHGGRTRRSPDRYVEGAPELVCEIAASSASYDLHEKLETYRDHGAGEYIVWRVEEEAIDWFINREGRFDRLAPSEDGLLKSEVFPGLWLDPKAMIDGDMARVLAVAQQGLASPEHAAFVARLNEQAQRIAAAQRPAEPPPEPLQP